MLPDPSTNHRPPGRARYRSQSTSVEEETAWRRIAQLAVANIPPGIAIGRWRVQHDTVVELHAPVLDDHYTIDVLLNETHVDCFKDGRRICIGNTGFGSTQIAAPGEEIRCVFERSSEAIHVFVPRTIVIATYEDIRQQTCPARFLLDDPCFAPLPALGRLALGLVDAAGLTGPFAALYCESVSIALLASLMETHTRTAVPGRHKGGLTSRQLNRAIEYMDSHLGESIGLHDIATYTGLSRMYFAAQFRNATGLTPFTFLIQRRIEKAKQLLSASRLPIAQVALEAGFQSQSHFTTVFRKFSGTTPARWRKSN
jgi:AraC family transcriptional regulator